MLRLLEPIAAEIVTVGEEKKVLHPIGGFLLGRDLFLRSELLVPKRAEDLNALRAALLMLLTLGHDSGAKPGAEIVGQFVELRVAINLDGFLGSVADNVTVVAPGKMIF
jgi:hypothetical protein